MTYITFGTDDRPGRTGPVGPDQQRGAASGLNLDGWVIMPFDFGGGTAEHGHADPARRPTG